MSLRVLQVVPRIATSSSGPSYSVTRLSAALSDEGHSVRLAVLEPVPAASRTFDVAGYPCARFPGAYRLGWSSAMRSALRRAARDVDVVHNHSMWMMPNIYSAQAASDGKVPLVFSPRGTLSEWARRRSRLRKEILWRLGQRNALFSAACVHATSDEELADIRRLGVRAPVALVPNGIDVPDSLPDRPSCRAPRTLIYLSRIHPKKGVDMLLQCWANLARDFPDWTLQIAGPLDGGYAASMQARAAHLGLERCAFVGELTGSAKTAALSSADLFVLPTHSENFGIAIAEALAHGTPVVTTEGAPWRTLADHGCGWSVPVDPTAIEQGLRQAMSLPSATLCEMGQRGRSWMQRDFSWSFVGRAMSEVYLWLRAAGPRPSTVVID